ncbi:MAG: glycerophosphoryl diester phosphodiesterase [Verrucomicrobiales bacterium]|jgi:glycerophosphoryl diester phosphodiesterase
MKSLKFISLLSLVFLGWVPLSNSGEKKPFHFAHRGGAHEFEENTLFAFKSCYEKGIRGYELDVRMTKDGELVVLHDDSLDRTHQSSGPVEHLTADEAKVIRTKKQTDCAENSQRIRNNKRTASMLAIS